MSAKPSPSFWPITAPTPRTAAAAVGLDIEYLPPAVSDAALACDANSPKTHSQHASNIAATMRAGFGDCARVFGKTDHVLTEHFDIHRGGCHSMECRGVVASIDLLTDALTIATSSQSPYMVRRHLAAYLKRDENDVRVMTPDVGGGLGQRPTFIPRNSLSLSPSSRVDVP